MLRIDIINTMKSVTTALHDSGVSSLIKSYRETMRSSRVSKTDTPNFITVFSNWTVIKSNFSIQEVKFIETMGLGVLLENDFWAKASQFFLLPENKERELSSAFWDIMLPILSSINLLENKLPTLIDLFSQHIGDLSNIESRSIQQDSKRSILKVILPEDDDEGSSPDRIAIIMKAIAGFYEIFSALERDEHSLRITVVAIDSGSDKSFDFIGAASNVAQIIILILGIYEDKKIERNMSHHDLIISISENLLVMKDLKEAVEAKIITNEEFERLKKRLLESIDQFVVAGAIIPEMGDVKPDDPRRIMSAETKLLDKPN